MTHQNVVEPVMANKEYPYFLVIYSNVPLHMFIRKALKLKYKVIAT